MLKTTPKPGSGPDPMNLKRTICWAIGIAVVASIAAYGEFARRTWQRDPSFLLACAEVDTLLASWTCKQALLHSTWNAEQLDSLNHSAGASLPVLMENSALAEEMLVLFIARGVDVNAVSQDGSSAWTALHGMILEGNIERVRMLLKHGARVDIQSKTGLTALDFSRQLEKKYPDDQKRREIVALLEDAAKREVEPQK